MSSVKRPAAGSLVLPATSVSVVLVVQTPSTDSTSEGTTWLIVKGPLPVAVPPCAGGRSAAVSTVLSGVSMPSGFFTTVVTVSPTFASAGSVMTMGVPPALAASAALTPCGASGSATMDVDGAWVSSVKPWTAGLLTAPLTAEVRVVRVLYSPSGCNWAVRNSWLIRPACRSAKLRVVAITCSVPPGPVSTVVTTSPTRAPSGKVVSTGTPPSESRSPALTCVSASLASGMTVWGAAGAAVVMLRLNSAEGARPETGPVAASTRTCHVYSPSASGAFTPCPEPSWNSQPRPSTLATPTRSNSPSPALRYTTRVCPGSSGAPSVPVSCGLVSLVSAPSATRPTRGPMLSIAPEISRAPTSTDPAPGSLVLPARSVAVATSWVSSGKTDEGRIVQLPSAPTGPAVPISLPAASLSVTVVPGSAVPLTN